MVSSHWGHSCGIILYGNSIMLMLKKPFFKLFFMQMILNVIEQHFKLLSLLFGIFFLLGI